MPATSRKAVRPPFEYLWRVRFWDGEELGQSFDEIGNELHPYRSLFQEGPDVEPALLVPEVEEAQWVPVDPTRTPFALWGERLRIFRRTYASMGPGKTRICYCLGKSGELMYISPSFTVESMVAEPDAEKIERADEFAGCARLTPASGGFLFVEARFPGALETSRDPDFRNAIDRWITEIGLL